ncbi:hypothetical protein F4561_001567 [Lipingzhangella halophila]|uniref:Uncharacterized protein n=1 Tax=Lipingzhangella halophila TaxID=1783352 RepID=A0A7W7W1A5_9ACTN|nr:hypothetical protein [Lipingzhangella halophila]MBB4930747.1 hypothetical protein [Lipingzhangella halophila]
MSESDAAPKWGFPVRASSLDVAWRRELREIDPADYTESDRARLFLSSVAGALAEQAIRLAETWDDGDRFPAALAADAVPLGKLATKALDYAVVTARVRGASWEDIGEQLGMTRQSAHTRWGELEAEWRRDNVGTSCIHPGTRAAGLDAWTERVNDPPDDPRIPHERRVSAALDVTADRSGHRPRQAARFPEGRAWNLVNRDPDLSARRRRRVTGFLALVYAAILHRDPGLAPDNDELADALRHAGTWGVDTDTVDASCARLDQAARGLLAREPAEWQAVLEDFVATSEAKDTPSGPHAVYWRDAVRVTTGADGFPSRRSLPVEDARRLLDMVVDPNGPANEPSAN